MLSREIVGAVLVGGSGSRMGGDKPDTILAGVTLRDRALSVLDLAFETVVLSVATSEDRLADRPVVTDRRSGLGPLAALESVLEFADGRPVFVLACDLPLVDTSVVQRIGTAAEEHGGLASVASCDGRCQPLCGLYSTSCLDAVRRHLDSGQLSMHGLLSDIEVNEVRVDDLGSEVLMNVNRLEDLARAERLLGG